MKKQIFAIVGYTGWGKSNTLYELFDRRAFQPLKAPISTKRFGDKKFTVINASNEDRPTKEYLERLRNVLFQHRKSETVFVITISLMFDKNHDVLPVFNELNSLTDYDVSYLVLNHGWDGKVADENDLRTMENRITKGKIHYFDTVIKKSKQKFKERTDTIAKMIDTKV